MDHPIRPPEHADRVVHDLLLLLASTLMGAVDLVRSELELVLKVDHVIMSFDDDVRLLFLGLGLLELLLQQGLPLLRQRFHLPQI